MPETGPERGLQSNPRKTQSWDRNRGRWPFKVDSKVEGKVPLCEIRNSEKTDARNGARTGATEQATQDPKLGQESWKMTLQG